MNREALLGDHPYEAPQTATEVAMAAIWTAALGVDRIGRADDFFDLGGDSMAAETLLAGVRQHFAVELPTSILLDQSSVALLSDVIDGQRQAGGATTTAFSLRSSAVPTGTMILIPPRRTNLAAFRDLAVGLRFEGDVLLLEHPAIDRIEGLAERHWRSLVELGKTLDVHLIGVCWGSLLAIEMARQAGVHGANVSSVVTFDPPPLLNSRHRLRSLLRARWPMIAIALDRFGLYRDELARQPATRWPAWLVSKARRVTSTVMESPAAVLDEELRDLMPNHPLSVATGRYVVRPVGRPVDLILTRDRANGASRRARDEWIRFLGADGRTHLVAGQNTGDAMSPARVAGLAQTLDRIADDNRKGSSLIR